jgi:hypothetical protein
MPRFLKKKRPYKAPEEVVEPLSLRLQLLEALLGWATSMSTARLARR